MERAESLQRTEEFHGILAVKLPESPSPVARTGERRRQNKQNLKGQTRTTIPIHRIVCFTHGIHEGGSPYFPESSSRSSSLSTTKRHPFIKAQFTRTPNVVSIKILIRYLLWGTNLNSSNTSQWKFEFRTKCTDLSLPESDVTRKPHSRNALSTFLTCRIDIMRIPSNQLHQWATSTNLSLALKRQMQVPPKAVVVFRANA